MNQQNKQLQLGHPLSDDDKSREMFSLIILERFLSMCLDCDIHLSRWKRNFDWSKRRSNLHVQTLTHSI